jgi:cytochrome c551/c552
MKRIFPFLIQAGILVLMSLSPSNSLSLADPDKHKDLFQTSDRCFACHNGLSTASGEDISIGLSWRPTMMANSARDPYWQAGVRRETIDHPESKAAIEDECAICHMPMARYQSRYEGRDAEVFARLARGADEKIDVLARDGVSCSMCHQITSDNLGTRESLVGGFVVDTTKDRGERAEYGPYKIEDGQLRVMRTSSGGYKPTEGEHIRKSELCATCHTLITKALGPGGQIIGQLPEQMPYQEWFASDFREKQSCQDCHMPKVEEETRIAVTLGLPRADMGRHVFVGGNFFMMRVLNKYRNDLGVWALPTEFDTAANRTIDHLKAQTIELSLDQVNVAVGRLQADITVENLSGHKFPTAYPSRRAWLHVTVRDRDNRVVFESGAIKPDGSIVGNDNDIDPGRFENHYTEITSADQVQIYEDIMVGTNNVPTTGLLTAVRFIKDNRLLPKGFNKNAVDPEIAPQGDAMSDSDFAGGGDKIRYTVNTGNAQGPFQIEAELWFQPISYRWANNLKPYDAMEPQRFTRYYDAMASGSGVMMARVTATR